MSEPTYDLDMLRKGVRAMERDVKTHEDVVEELRRRIAEYERHIAVAEAIERAKRNGSPH